MMDVALENAGKKTKGVIYLDLRNLHEDISDGSLFMVSSPSLPALPKSGSCDVRTTKRGLLRKEILVFNRHFINIPLA